MKIKQLAYSILFSIILFLGIGFFSTTFAVVKINEFSTNGSSDWIELFNTDSSTSVDLSTYSIQLGGSPIAISGTLPKLGLLTIALDSQLNDTAATINLLNGVTGVDSIVYGSGSDVPTAPGSGQSAYRTTDGGSSWAVGTPTKGWFNSSSTAPTQSSLATTISNGGTISTNFGTIPDLSRAQNLYFEKVGYGKILFTATLNMTDTTVATWLQNLGTKLEMNAKGVIGLDAETVSDLKNAGATLTMYGLTLNDPTISVQKTDGSDDNSGAVSGLTYDKASGQLTFNAAHFTKFTANEKSSGGGSSSSTSSSSTNTPGCSDQAPTNNPHLFQIDTKNTSAILYFTPVNDHVSYYYIAYGLTPGEERYGVTFQKGAYSGVLNFTVNMLSPHTIYYFKVRGGNGCAPGRWSNNMKAVTEGGNITSIVSNEQTFVPEKKSVIQDTTIEKNQNSSLTPTTIEQKASETQQPVNPPVSEPVKKSFIQRIVDFIFRRR